MILLYHIFMIIQFLNACNLLNDKLFEGVDGLISSIPMADWLLDAILDSIHTLPLLFIVFLIIEAIEYFYADKINQLIKSAEKAAIAVGAALAIIPQCGFSIIATSLYLRKYLTKGTLIAIYLATSDEAIPILLTQPDKVHYIIPIISLKLIIGIIAGYLIDFVLKDTKYVPITEDIEEHSGCCHHSIDERHPKELLIHPLKHTLNIFGFILVITIFLNFFINVCLQYPCVHNFFHNIRFVEPVITAILGLIPNCAISVGLTMMLINGTLKFSAVMAGLLSNAGLGLLVLFKQHGNYKDTAKIISILIAISIISGYILQMFNL